MITVYYSETGGGIPPVLWEKGRDIFPDVIMSKCKRFYHRRDRDNALMGKLLLAFALYENGYGKEVMQKLSWDDYGKPYLDIPFEFNISHSGCHVLLAFSETKKVGIDIEVVRPINLNDFEKMLTKSERSIIMTSHEKPDLVFDLFYSMWTIKESVLKAYGKGLSIPFSEVRINNLCFGYSTSINDLKKSDAFYATLFGERWFIKQLFPSPTAKCHLAYRNLANENKKNMTPAFPSSHKVQPFSDIHFLFVNSNMLVRKFAYEN